MIQKLEEKQMIRPYEVGEKLNELIDAYNNHVHKSDGSETTKTPQGVLKN